MIYREREIRAIRFACSVKLAYVEARAISSQTYTAQSIHNLVCDSSLDSGLRVKTLNTFRYVILLSQNIIASRTMDAAE
jgi:hypothetical protein